MESCKDFRRFYIYFTASTDPSLNISPCIRNRLSIQELSCFRYVVVHRFPSIYLLFIRSLKFAEHLNVTTLLGDNIRSSPVAGLRSLRCFLFLTWNLPKPDIKTSSPDSRASLMISIRILTISAESF